MTGTAATGGSPDRPRPAHGDQTSEVTTVNTTSLQDLQHVDLAVAARPKAAAATAVAAVCTGTTGAYGKALIGGGTTGTWLATSRLSMNVPAFHDRRPLCSTT